MSDTIVAIATAPGLAGVAIVRLSGADAWELAAKLTVAPLVEPNRAELRAIRSKDGELIDRALVLGFKAPKSYTGEDVVEFQCHGGTVTPRRILEAAIVAGARLARRGEFTERAFLHGKLDYDQAESVLDLVHAKTDRAADAALAGLSGRKQRELKTLYDAALEISSTLEHALDVSEAELPASFYEKLQGEIAAFKAKVADAIRSRKETRLLRDGALVVLAGAPNAGKSSLLNALLKENRAIVSDVPGTTRDSIEVWMELEGFPIRLVDTAGLRETQDAIEGAGVRRSEELIAQADIVLYLTPQSSSFSPNLPNLPNLLNLPNLPNLPQPSSFLPIHAKCDLGHGEGINVSAKTGEGLDALKAEIVKKLETLEPPTDDPSLSTLIEISSLLPSFFLLPPSPHPSSFLLPSSSFPLVLMANQVRTIAEKLGSLIGATYSADLLDHLFSRFCVGK